MNAAAPLLLTFLLLASCAAAQSAAPGVPTAPTLPPAERYGVQLGGIPPFFLSAGGYKVLTDLGAGQLEGRALISTLGIPTFITALGAEADLLASYPLSVHWKVYGGVAAAFTSTSVNNATNYFGLGGLVGVRSGPGLGFFIEAGVGTFFGGFTGPFGRTGVTYSF
ncbi:hypothetical protein EHF33_13045 [Deinococcus psychrotolerans]|uniref:Uncharacterized protein n=1 Tax=Deinococcus psychrotolerans TaxID=2489213 RepID=A0A3G8YFA7_9DEIO|nr:hypothetical protein [Deinococcus psychrotolerans]AZI43560.1 hypothetical protein EHF33_13045 [Deinococcus psychrotolerans]